MQALYLILRIKFSNNSRFVVIYNIFSTVALLGWEGGGGNRLELYKTRLFISTEMIDGRWIYRHFSHLVVLFFDLYS